MSRMAGFSSLPEPYALSMKQKDTSAGRRELRTPPSVKLLDLVEPASSGEGPSRYYTCLGMFMAYSRFELEIDLHVAVRSR
jgi:hypothetical protein